MNTRAFEQARLALFARDIEATGRVDDIQSRLLSMLTGRLRSQLVDVDATPGERRGASRVLDELIVDLQWLKRAQTTSLSGVGSAEIGQELMEFAAPNVLPEMESRS